MKWCLPVLVTIFGSRLAFITISSLFTVYNVYGSQIPITQAMRGQFHQHFTSTCFVRKCFTQLSLVTFQLCNFWRQNIVSIKY